MAIKLSVGDIVKMIPGDDGAESTRAMVLAEDGNVVIRDVTKPKWRNEFNICQTLTYQAGDMIHAQPGSNNPIFVSACGRQIVSWSEASQQDRQLFSTKHISAIHGHGVPLCINYTNSPVISREPPNSTTANSSDLKASLQQKHVLPGIQKDLQTLLDSDGISHEQERCAPLLLLSQRQTIAGFLNQAERQLDPSLFKKKILPRAQAKIDYIENELAKCSWAVRVKNPYCKEPMPDSSPSQHRPSHSQGM